MAKVMAFLRAVPKYLYLIVAGAVGILLLLFRARRQGEAIGAAKATAKAEVKHVEQLESVAKEAASEAVDARRESDERPTDSEAATKAESAEEDAREEAGRLGSDLLQRLGMDEPKRR